MEVEVGVREKTVIVILRMSVIKRERAVWLIAITIMDITDTVRKVLKKNSLSEIVCMNIFFQIFFLVACFFFTQSLYSQENRTFVLHGIIDTVDNAVYYISYKNKGERVEDTVQLKGKNLSVKGNISEPTRLFISVDNDYDPRIAGDYVVYELWVEPGKEMEFHGYAGFMEKPYYNYKLTNSPTDSLKRKYLKLSKEAELTDKESEDNFDKKFIKENLTSFYALNILYWKSRNEETDPDDIRKMLLQLPDDFKELYTYKDIENRLAMKDQLQVGNVFPDFEMKDTESSMVKFSDFPQGNYVFIDFWASWCAPCRKENPYLVKTYKRFHDQGFDILGVSLDEDREAWLQAIKDDGLVWQQVSDLKGLENELAKSLYIRAIPDNFLLAPDGTILARDLRGKELYEFMEKIYSK